MAQAIRFANPYQGYNPSTIFRVDQNTKTLSPFASGDAYTQAGFQFGQEQLVSDPNQYAGYNVGAIINPRSQALSQVTQQLNQFQNDAFSQQNEAPKRQSSTLQDRIDSGTQELNDALAEFKTLKDSYTKVQAPNYQQAYTDLRASQGIPQIEADFVNVRKDRREMPYVQRANTGKAGVATEGQLQEQIYQNDIPLEAREANILDRLKLAENFVNNSLKLKEMDFSASRDGLTTAMSIVSDIITQQRAGLSDLRAERDTERTRADAALQFRLENNITTPFFDTGGTIFDAGSLEGIPDEKTFQQKYGMSLQDAEARGLVTKLDGGIQAQRSFVFDLASKYPDAGILPSDSLSAAQAKMRTSRIYQDQVRGPVGSGGGGGTGTLAGTHIIDQATDSAVRSIIASRPGDGGYGAAYEAVKARFGTQVASAYDKVYQAVFNSGASVDAAFNDAKLGAVRGGLVNEEGKPVKLTAAQQSSIAEWNTVADLSSQALSLGEQIGFSGVGGGYKGSLMQFMAKQFGRGTQEEEQLRNLISNIQGTLAKARGGTSFTESEKRLLESYTPTINDSPSVIKAKLGSLQQFINTAVGNIQRSAGAVNVAPTDVITQSDGTVWQKNQDGTYTQIQ